MSGDEGIGAEDGPTAVDLPSYWLSRPPLAFSPDTLTALESVYLRAVLPGRGEDISEALPVEKWRFLCFLAEHKGLLMHGSSDSSITEFEPRQPQDVEAFSSQNAVYAASDGLWAMFFAILNRPRIPSMINACVRAESASGRLGEPRYFFSVSGSALTDDPWSGGTVYLLPRDTFVPQPPQVRDGVRVHISQWVSLSPVRPLAKLRVSAHDFPMLTQIRGHDDQAIWARAQADPGGFPWATS